jgi:c-di-GMP-binding flagellar brake protein YcgR
LIASQQSAGVSFRSGESKVIFATQIQHFQPEFEMAHAVDDAGGGPVAALLLKFPTEVRAVQRRKSFRVAIVPGSSDLQVKLWTMTEQATLRDKPAASREISCDPRDISIGGLGVTIRGANGKPPNLATGDRIRIQLTLRAATVVLEGRLRYPPRAGKDASFRAGVQFRTLDDSREDRLAATQLNKIVNELQRDLIRRKKLGLPVPTA